MIAFNLFIFFRSVDLRDELKDIINTAAEFYQKYPSNHSTSIKSINRANLALIVFFSQSDPNLTSVVHGVTINSIATLTEYIICMARMDDVTRFSEKHFLHFLWAYAHSLNTFIKIIAVRNENNLEERNGKSGEILWRSPKYFCCSNYSVDPKKKKKNGSLKKGGNRLLPITHGLQTFLSTNVFHFFFFFWRTSGRIRPE